MKLSNKLTSISNHFKYYAALVLAEDGPQAAVRHELSKENWTFKSKYSEEELKAEIAASTALGHGVIIPFNRTVILSPENEEVFQTQGNRNTALEDRYKQAVRKAAARVYNIDN